MSLREIPVVHLERPPPPKKGAQPGGVIWVDPSELMVDTRYQRDLGPFGIRRVQEIASQFDWRKFLPILVAKRAGGGYVVIDGQHRSAAVLARGDIAKIPAWVIEADLAEQARTFLTINAESARVQSGAMWYARAATGDLDAKLLFELCGDAGVEVLKFPMGASARRSSQTVAATCIHEMRTRVGSGAIRWTLLVLVEAGRLVHRSLLSQRLIRALAPLRKDNPAWAEQRQVIAHAISSVKVEQLEAKAAIASREKGRGARQEIFTGYLRDHIETHLARAPKAAA